MKKFIVILICILTLCIVCGARADVEEVIEEDVPVQIVDIKMKDTYEPLDCDIRPLTNYMNKVTDEEIETLERLLWSSPLDDEEQKIKLLWLVFNRVNSRSSTFADMDTVAKAVTIHEFPWYDRKAHLSQDNERIVTEQVELYNLWFSGEDIGSHPSGQGMYCSFWGPSNENITLYDYSWYEVE